MSVADADHGQPDAGQAIAEQKKHKKPNNISFVEKYDQSDESHEGAKTEKEPTDSKSEQFPWQRSIIRYLIIVVALMSTLVTSYSKTIIPVIINNMIDPNFIERTTSLSNDNSSIPIFDRDNSCPVTDLEKRNKLLYQRKKDIKGAGGTYQWSGGIQSMVKSAYGIGHVPFQVPGSRLSEIFGSHKIISISALSLAILCFSAPFLADIHYLLLLMDITFLGVIGGFMSPGLITFFSNWLSPGEKPLFMTFYLVSSRLGQALSFKLCEVLESRYSWRMVFYSSGLLSAIFTVLFYLIASSRPIDNPLISEDEIKHLALKNKLIRESLASRDQKTESIELKTKNEQTTKTTNHSKKEWAHWQAIFTNGPVWAFIITKLCVKLCGDTATNELPTYLKRVMHFQDDANSNSNAIFMIVFCSGCLINGFLAKLALVKQRQLGMDKTTIRKIFQSLASFGVALAYLGIALNVCNDTVTVVFFIVINYVTTFGTGGESQIPLDISERYAGTIHAIGSSISISSAIVSPLVLLILGGQKHQSDRDRWQIVWFLVSGVSMVGGLVFIILGDAKIQGFDSLGMEEKEEVEVEVVVKSITPKPNNIDKDFESIDLSSAADNFRSNHQPEVKQTNGNFVSVDNSAATDLENLPSNDSSRANDEADVQKSTIEPKVEERPNVPAPESKLDSNNDLSKQDSHQDCNSKL